MGTIHEAWSLLYTTGWLLVAATLFACVLGRRDARHRPVAAALVVLAGGMLIRLVLHALVLHGGPYAGWARVAFHVEQFTRLATAMVPAAVTWATMAPEERAEVRRLGGWLRGALPMCAGVWLTLVICYPDIRGDRLRLVYLVAELASLFVATVTVAAWLRRRWWRRMAHRSHTWLAVLMIVAADFALLFVGAWPHGLFGAAYRLQQAGLVALYGALVLLHVIALKLKMVAP